LGETGYLQAAQKAASFIKKNLYNPETRLLFRRWRQGESKIPGLAADYAFLTQGLLDLYESDFDQKWLDWAVTLADEQIKLFYDSDHGGFFMTRKDHDQNLIMRVKEDHDSVIPAAGSIAVSNLVRLARMTDSETYSTVAGKSLQSMLSHVSLHPDSAAQLLVARIVYLSKPVEIIIAGKRDNEDTQLMVKAAHSVYLPGKIVMLVDNDAAQGKPFRQFPFSADVKQVSGKATAYVCIDHACRPPITDPSALTQLLN